MSDTSNQEDTQQEAQQDRGEQQAQDNAGQSTAKKQTNKLENPESIPSAGGKQIGEDHKGESKMLSENARSESVAAQGDADDIQRQLEGKSASSRPQGGEDGGEKKGMVEKAKEKLGLNKDKE